jgi:hypothetical protein
MKRKNPPRLNFEDAVELQGTIESEGFDYAFRFYSSFKDVKDKKFHSLRKAYVKAAQELSDYIRLEEDLLCNECGEPMPDGTCKTFHPAQGMDDNTD